jgi:diguanylate cyclase (GGDEF)-like protein
VGRDLSEHRYDAAVSAVLPPVSLALAVVVALLLLVDLPAETGARVTTIVVAAAGLLLLGGLAALGWRGRVPERLANPLLAAALAGSAGCGALHVWLADDGGRTTGVLLVLTAAGAFVLDRRWYLVTVVATVGLWAAAGTGVAGSPGTWPHVVVVAGATALGLAIGVTRRAAIDRYDEVLERARRASVEDPLTGLLNRRGLQLVGTQVEASARRAGNAMHCVFVDVDGLKAVNDRRGHAAGDQVLLAVADAIRLSVRSGDVVGRWGGDEFTVLGPGPGTAPVELERRIVARLQDMPPDGVPGWVPGVSAGSAMLAPWDDGDLTTLLDQADREMYRRRALRRSDVVPTRPPD